MEAGHLEGTMTLDIIIQYHLANAIRAARLDTMTAEQRMLADILIRNCRDDLLRWPSLADDIISDLKAALEGVREGVEA